MKPASNLKPYLAIAASLVLLLGFTSYRLYTSMSDLENKITQVESEVKNSEMKNKALEQEMQNLIGEYDLVVEDLALLNNPETDKLLLKGNLSMPNALAVSYVNHREKKVVINAKGLPELSQDEDYQLWADVEGEMIDMGIVPSGKSLIAMTYIEDAESYNITIEPSGGSDHPTVERLIANVYLD